MNINEERFIGHEQAKGDNMDQGIADRLDKIVDALKALSDCIEALDSRTRPLYNPETDYMPLPDLDGL